MVPFPEASVPSIAIIIDRAMRDWRVKVNGERARKKNRRAKTERRFRLFLRELLTQQPLLLALLQQRLRGQAQIPRHAGIQQKTH